MRFEEIEEAFSSSKPLEKNRGDLDRVLLL
jgi:hypothetical protein